VDDDSPVGLHQGTPSDLRERLAAERRGTPFVVYRDDDGVQRIVGLTAGPAHTSFGRSPECDVCLAWDPEVSRLHAEIAEVGDQWVITDDGLSSNGTFIGGERLAGRRRLVDGDVLRLGGTAIAFRRVTPGGSRTTRVSQQPVTQVSVTPSQRRVLLALCRPFKGGAHDAVPATNPQIAAELFLTVAAVKTHLRALCRSFGIDELPQQEKRRRLVALAMALGTVRDRDL
jgi:pSer/pThr/pTyr-binding forkhead associated (FHA) protein